MTAFQSLALVGILFVTLAVLIAAWRIEMLTYEVREANGLLRDLLKTMRDRL